MDGFILCISFVSHAHDNVSQQSADLSHGGKCRSIVFFKKAPCPSTDFDRSWPRSFRHPASWKMRLKHGRQRMAFCLSTSDTPHERCLRQWLPCTGRHGADGVERGLAAALNHFDSPEPSPRVFRVGAILRQSHLTYALEYGALLMDINIDRLALRCFSTASRSRLSWSGKVTNG